MNVVHVTDEYSASSQITPEDVAEIKAAGFRAIMCNRPDGEDPGQPAFAAIAAAAAEQGLAAVHLPVVSGGVRPENVADFAKAVADLPKPLFAYCRSGARCQNLWLLSR